jgi:hypothetical protein
MRRAALERARTRRVWLQHLRTHDELVNCDCELQPGRFRKSQKVGGCGRPHCWLCHYSKLADIPTPQELRMLERYREGLAEVSPSNNRLQRAVRDKVPASNSQRPAAEPGR